MVGNLEFLNKMNLTIRGLNRQLSTVYNEVNVMYEKLDINNDVRYTIRDIKEMERRLQEKKEHCEKLLIKKEAWEQCRDALFGRMAKGTFTHTCMDALEALKRYDDNYEAALLQHGENIISEPVYEHQGEIDQLECLIKCQFNQQELDYIRLKVLGCDGSLKNCINMSSEEIENLTANIEVKLLGQEAFIGEK